MQFSTYEYWLMKITWIYVVACLNKVLMNSEWIFIIWILKYLGKKHDFLQFYTLVVWVADIEVQCNQKLWYAKCEYMYLMSGLYNVQAGRNFHLYQFLHYLVGISISSYVPPDCGTSL